MPGDMESMGVCSDSTQLHEAIKAGDLAKVQLQLEAGADINHILGMKGSPLIAAINTGQVDIVRHLVGAGCNVNQPDYDGQPPLCLAIEKGRNAAARVIVAAQGFDLNCRDCIDDTPAVVVAVRCNNLEMLGVLMERGCDLNATDSYSRTALHHAVFKGYCEAVHMLLSSELCNPNLMDKFGVRPITDAATQEDGRVLRTMLQFVSRDPTEDKTFQRDVLTSPPSQHSDTSRVLVEFRSEEPHLRGSTLHMAARVGLATNVADILKAGADPNLEDGQSMTPLHVACRFKHRHVADLLLSAGADPNKYPGMDRQFLYHFATSDLNMPPIFCAAIEGDVTLLEMLINAGADLNCRDIKGSTVLHQALIKGKHSVVEYLLSEGVRCGLDVRLRDRDGWTPLYAVSYCDHQAAVTHRLIELGCSVDDMDKLGTTPVCAAVGLNCVEVVRVLFEHGAPVNHFSNGMTPLHLAAMDDLYDIAKLCLLYGADMNLATGYAHATTAFTLALENGNVEMASLLLQCGYNASKEPHILQPGVTDPDDPYSAPVAFEMDSEFREVALSVARSPQPLSKQCGVVIRSHLQQHSIPVKCIEQLPLPHRLIDFLMLRLVNFTTKL